MGAERRGQREAGPITHDVDSEMPSPFAPGSAQPKVVNINGGTFNIYDGIQEVKGHDVGVNSRAFGSVQGIHSSPDGLLLDRLASNINFRAIQQEVRKKWTPGTGKWFLKSRLYKEWKASGGGVLWGMGIPGAGKTVLASNVANDLLQLEAESNGRVAVIVVYCRYTEPLSVKEILEAILRQYLECHPHLVDLIAPLYAQHDRKRTSPSEEELVELLWVIESQFGKCYYIIDGVDEAKVNTQFELIDAINKLRGNFFLSSRPLDHLGSDLLYSVFFTIDAQREDILLLITEKLNRNKALLRLVEQRGYRKMIDQQIIDKAAGMFLHAALQAELITSSLTIESLMEGLRAFPADITNMYEAAVERIRGQTPALALLGKHILLWLAFAREAFSVPTLRHAVSASGGEALREHSASTIESFQIALLSACCGLVTIETKTNQVRLVHFTAKDALASILTRDFPDPHFTLFQVATDQLTAFDIPNSQLRTQRDLDDTLSRAPLLRYAYEHFPDHARKCMDNPKVFDAVFRFLQLCTAFPCNLNSRPQSWDELDLLSPVHVIARFGIPVPKETLTAAIDDLNSTTTGATGATPLILAAAYSHLEVMNLLLTVKRWDRAKAVLYRKTSVTRNRNLFSPVNVNACDAGGKTALMYASRRGLQVIVRRLLQVHGIKVNLADAVEGWTALMHACFRGHEDIVQLLLQVRGIDVNHSDNDGQTALMHASRGGYEAVVLSLLLSKGIQVNRRDADGQTALMIAAGPQSWRNSRSVVELLLQVEGLQLDLVDDGGKTAMDHALAANRPEVVSLLKTAEERTGKKRYSIQ
ncbi:hypothetical protein CC1G_08380 [Coprinopsis cinerea okayama7|uniref:Nephrocystin 3-like N-terminal domain-containing protein n=1 Tax=Coprinopsis cinerea (strain Okayama-7 / 130 / ATCC MYA-4618 / FGSC 9003) TaxID=240176 RepID=A8NAL1_COPC7|nr:hypothetical protein CC1G_08380 [Coprinopsis cinerea okayama7\|eukprot:XP_001831863.2 hypothetical protein CC1G_08380 [Coprinopsis cinerea okayama7\